MVFCYQVVPVQANSNKKNDKKRQDRPRHLLRTAVASATLLGYAIITPSYANLYEPHNMAPRVPFNVERTAEFADSIKIAEELKRISPEKTAESQKYMNQDYIFKMLDVASSVSKERHIPKEFIFVQWMMESGFLQRSGFYYINKNNLAGIKKMDGSGKFVPKEFGSIDEFSRYYADILRKDGVHDQQNFWPIVVEEGKHGYFGPEEPGQYGRKLIATLSVLKNATPEYDKYYEKVVNEKKPTAIEENQSYGAE